jgi:hypothetical protein
MELSVSMGVTAVRNRRLPPYSPPPLPGCQPTARDRRGPKIPENAAFNALWRTSGDVLGWADGGASRDRTDDLIHAMDALSQLSYSPVRMTLFLQGNLAPLAELRGRPVVLRVARIPEIWSLKSASASSCRLRAVRLCRSGQRCGLGAEFGWVRRVS